MNFYIDINKIEIDEKSLKNLRFLYENYMEHKFDLLGSGPVKVTYGMKANGFSGICYDNKTKYIDSYRSTLWLLKIIKPLDYMKSYKFIEFIDKDYEPIDWHIDFKSGFRFDAHEFDNPKECLNVIGNKKAVEIKVSWELGRFYHFPQLAVLAVKDLDKRKKIIKEFKNEILDFIITNPYKKTVQWSAVMDTSIRLVNLLISYDIMKKLDCDDILDNEFDSIFESFIKLQGEYVINNLEYGGKVNSNHYLSNIVGMVFVAAYLKQSDITDAWLVFATQELIEQVKVQYNDDGSHFEASTSYHRLSTEFVLYSVALIQKVLQTERKSAYIKYNYKLVERLKRFNQQKYDINSKEFFPKWFVKKLFLSGIFTQSIMKDNDEIVQIGDNDSGRLVKFSPVGEILDYKEALKKYENLYKSKEKYYFDENVINHSTLLSALSALFEGDNPLMEYSEKLPLEYSLINSLVGDNKFEWNLRENSEIDFYDIDKLKDIKFKYTKISEFEFDGLKNELDRDLKFEYFEDFGICLFKLQSLYLCISIDTTQRAMLFGHSHNDKLSFELFVDGKPIVLDAGGYIYTSNPSKRNQFRSVRKHSTIIVDNIEQDDFRGVFNKTNRARGFILDKGENYIRLYARYGGIHHIREFYIENNKIVIKDYCNENFKSYFNKYSYSNGYGKLIRKEWIKDDSK